MRERSSHDFLNGVPHQRQFVIPPSQCHYDPHSPGYDCSDIQDENAKDSEHNDPRWVGWSTSILNVIVLIGLFLLFSSNDLYTVQFAVSPVLVAVMMLASISALLTLGMVFCSFLVWRMPTRNQWQCLSYALQALAGIAFSVDLNFWHLLWLPVNLL